MDRIPFTYGAYVYATSNSITSTTSQFEDIKSYQSAPPLRHLPILNQHYPTSNHNNSVVNTTLIHRPVQNFYRAHDPLVNKPAVPNFDGNNLYDIESPTPTPPTFLDLLSADKTLNKTKGIERVNNEKKRWNTSDFRWMFTKRNGSISGKLNYENFYQKLHMWTTQQNTCS